MKRQHRTPCVLLISPGILKWTDMDFGLPHLVSMGGYLLRALGSTRVRVEIMDLNYEGTDHQTLALRLETLAPFVCIGLSCYSSFDYMRVLSLGRFMKSLYPDTPLLTGGYHASALPRDLIFEGSPFDAVIKGEGEQALTTAVERLLGGAQLETPWIEGGVVEDLDSLPMYQWQLLNRYWPHAHEIGRKFQIYLSRGCPYRCAFCMERAKSGYQWRAYSPQRAIAELEHLSSFTDLNQWIINLADPLFGLKRSWRREVLEGMIERDLTPRQYWTLTRSDDLQEEDVKLLARARFSIGIGMESGSPRMLEIMQKGNKPAPYLAALERLALLSRKHGLNWAANVIIGHPGEDRASLQETFEYVRRLFTSASETCGWLSIDPFRLYPGALIHEEIETYESKYGARFYHKEWWKSWYDGSFKAEHIDPSATLSFEERVRFMYDQYPPLIEQILKKFRGQGRSVDQVFRRSLDEQVRLMSPQTRDLILAHGARVKKRQVTALSLPSDPSDSNQDTTGSVKLSSSTLPPSAHSVPMGINIKNPLTRRREEVIRLFLETGALRSQNVIDALLTIPPEDHLSPEIVEAFLEHPYVAPPLNRADKQPETVSFYALAVGLEAMAPCAGDQVMDALASSSYLSAILAHAVGIDGRVFALHPGGRLSAWTFERGLKTASALITARSFKALEWKTTLKKLKLTEPIDSVWIGAALPRTPHEFIDILCEMNGRLVTFLGPRFRPQDLVCLTRVDGQFRERLLARTFAHVAIGQGGWVNA